MVSVHEESEYGRMDPQHPSSALTPREGYVPVEGARLYFRDIGQGPAIIVLHGGPGFDHNYLLPDMDRLIDAFRLIYYDQRGCGRSGEHVQPEDVSLHSEMDDLEGVRAYFQQDSVALLGHSWGGLLAMEYALRHPQRVSHLILLNTAPASHDDCLLFMQERDTHAPMIQRLGASCEHAEPLPRAILRSEPRTIASITGRPYDPQSCWIG